MGNFSNSSGTGGLADVVTLHERLVASTLLEWEIGVLIHEDPADRGISDGGVNQPSFVFTRAYHLLRRF